MQQGEWHGILSTLPLGQAARVCSKEALARGNPWAQQASLPNKWLILTRSNWWIKRAYRNEASSRRLVSWTAPRKRRENRKDGRLIWRNKAKEYMHYQGQKIMAICIRYNLPMLRKHSSLIRGSLFSNSLNKETFDIAVQILRIASVIGFH